MAIIWHEPRKKAGSIEPKITISQQFFSFNKAAIEKYFNDTDRIKIGYDQELNRLVFLPLKTDDKKGMKIITNVNSSSKYINAARLFINFNLVGPDLKVKSELRGEYKCLSDSAYTKGVFIDLNTGKNKE